MLILRSFLEVWFETVGVIISKLLSVMTVIMLLFDPHKPNGRGRRLVSRLTWFPTCRSCARLVEPAGFPHTTQLVELQVPVLDILI